MKDNDEFRISVIIPAYNVEKYVEKAVKSALNQPEVAEVLVIDDGSKDDTPKILAKISADDFRIQILSHKGRRNKGRSASRNLGIKAATSNFIAFLDADDYYLEKRFTNDKLLFKQHRDIDGVYNAIGVHFYRRPKNKNEEDRLKLTTITKKVAPEELFWYKSPKGCGGHISGNGLTIKRKIFDKVGFFNEELEVAEDSEMWIKMSLKSKLYPGIIDRPVSVRGVHDNNISMHLGNYIYNKSYFSMYNGLTKWAQLQYLDKEIISFFRKSSYKYLLRLVHLNTSKVPTLKANIFILKMFFKESLYICVLNYLLYLGIYKKTGLGYNFRIKVKEGCLRII